MRISLSKGRISVDPEGKLDAHQLSQLRYYGFQRSDSDHSVLGMDFLDDDTIIVRLTEYLTKENISFSVDEPIQKILSQLKSHRGQLAVLRSKARSFKRGNRLNSFDEFQEFARRHVHRHLKSHQLKAAFHFYLVRNAANFSVPGSGKTSVVLSVYEKLRLEGRVNIVFVIGPPACFGPWKNEFKETLNRQPIARVLAGGGRQSRELEYFRQPAPNEELYLSTFQTVANDYSLIRSFFSQKGVNAFLVVDEAHYIKQIGGIWANAIIAISSAATFRGVLTGTPIPNKYIDLFNIFDFLWGKDVVLDLRTKSRIRNCEEAGRFSEAKQVLDETIGPLFYRVRKSDLGLTPQVFHDPIVVAMNKIEKKIYNAIVSKIREYSTQDFLKNIDLVKRLRKGRIMRLRQCTSFAKLLSTAVDDYQEDLIEGESDLAKLITGYEKLETPAKLRRLITMLEELRFRQEKVVVWCHFVAALEFISKSLTSNTFRNKCIYGKIPAEQTALEEEENRESIIVEFLDPSSGLDILLANPAACAESISLHKTCHTAIYYDLSYNAAQFLQSLDRIHRVGGSETTSSHYYFLQYEKTVDQDIRANLDNKARKMSHIVDQDFPIYSLDMFEEDNEEETAYQRLFGSTLNGTS